MTLIQRVQDILLKPKETWPAVAAEPADVASIYRNYLVYLAAIPAICGFIGLTLMGAGALGFQVRIPFASGLVHMVLSYVLSLVAVYVLALIANALAPTFNGTKNTVSALKLVAYGSTAGFLGGVFSLIPSLGILGILAALYSIYLIYTGIPVLMKAPPEKAGAYTAVVIVCGFVAMIVLGAVTSLAMPGRGMSMVGLPGGSSSGDGEVSIKTPGGEITINTAKLEEASKRMEAAGKRMEQANASGDVAAAGKAMSEAMGAMTGSTGTPIAAADLKALLPESVGDLKRESMEAQSNAAMGFATSMAKAAYAGGDKRLELSVVDTGGFAGLATMAAWANLTVDKETNDAVEKVYKQGRRTMRESYRKDGSRSELTVILENGVMVEAQGDHIDPASLKSVVDGLGLAKVEALKRSVAKQ
ncbi:MAG: Yip1 family protein [Rhizobacter sp.]